jgi:hypothetical protein
LAMRHSSDAIASTFDEVEYRTSITVQFEIVRDE